MKLSFAEPIFVLRGWQWLKTERQRSNPHPPSHHISSAGSFIPCKYLVIQFCCHLLFFFQQQWKRRIGLLSPVFGRTRWFSLLAPLNKDAIHPSGEPPPGDLQTKHGRETTTHDGATAESGVEAVCLITDQRELCNDSFDRVHTIGIGATQITVKTNSKRLYSSKFSGTYQKKAIS